MYDETFFDSIEAGARESASVIVPIVLTLVPAKRVVDIGCGRGVWLRAFQDNGVSEIRGLDGAYVRAEDLLIQPACFRAVDLAGAWHLDEQYDLAVCLEVAEHLPARSARPLVRALTSAAPFVLFSAAVPNQVGRHHINEQWPAYWEKLFGAVGYRRLDPIRRHIVHDERVAPWYRQNVLLYVSDKELAESPLLQSERDYAERMPLEYIDKRVLGHLTSPRAMLRQVPRAVLRGLRNRLYGW